MRAALPSLAPVSGRAASGAVDTPAGDDDVPLGTDALADYNNADDDDRASESAGACGSLRPTLLTHSLTWTPSRATPSAATARGGSSLAWS